MRRILPVIVFLSFGVVALFAQLRNSHPGIPGFVESVSVLNPNKIELKTSPENSILGLYAKHSVDFQQQSASVSLNMVLDSTITKDATDNYLNKTVYFKDVNERDTLIAQYTWNGDTLEWDLSMKNNLTYDSRGNITLSTSVVDYGGFILGTLKYTAMYDANNHQTEYISYTWDFLSFSWVPSTKIVSVYTNGKKMSDTNYAWISATSSWKLNSKTDYSYDANGFLTGEITQKANISTSLLENDVKYVFMNDAAGRDTLSTEYKWASNTSTWNLFGKTVMTYASSGAPTTVTSYQWNSATSLWVGLFRSVYAFAANSSLTSVISYTWDTNSSAWVGSNKSEFLYNANGYMSVNTFYEWSANAWAKQTVINYYYSPSKFTTLNEIEDSSGMKIYPNPVTDFLKISNLTKPASASIASIDGRTIIYNSQLTEAVIDVTGLKTGIYFLFINTGDGKYTYKFIKK
ncbi:MAG: T9SS type A sorting domain-containing protein [Paludibacter sp.]